MKQIADNHGNYFSFPGGIVDKNSPTNAETQILSLFQEDFTCYRANKSMCHNYWTYDLGSMSYNCWSPYA